MDHQQFSFNEEGQRESRPWKYQHVTLTSSPSGNNIGNNSPSDFQVNFGTNFRFEPFSEICLTNARLDFGALTVDWPAGASINFRVLDSAGQFEDAAVVLSKDTTRIEPFDFVSRLNNEIALAIQNQFTEAKFKNFSLEIAFSYINGFKFNYSFPGTGFQLLLTLNNGGINLAPFLGFTNSAYFREGAVSGTIAGESYPPLTRGLNPLIGVDNPNFQAVNVLINNLPLDNFYAIEQGNNSTVATVGQPPIIHTLPLPTPANTVLSWQAKTENWFKLNNPAPLEVNNFSIRIEDLAGGPYDLQGVTVLTLMIRGT